jgi:hypothetical protein
MLIYSLHSQTGANISAVQPRGFGRTPISIVIMSYAEPLSGNEIRVLHS